MIFEIINVKFNNCLCVYINKNEFEKLTKTKHLDEFIQKSKNLYVGLPKTSDIHFTIHNGVVFICE